MDQSSYVFRCLDLEIYRRERPGRGFRPGQFYREYIASDVLFNEPHRFYGIAHEYPKDPHSVRTFHFLSFEMQIVYYAIGLYVHDLLRRWREDRHKHRRREGYCQTYYGGSVRFDDPAQSQLFYYRDFSEFSSNVQHFVDQKRRTGPVAVLKFDIEAFYPSVDHRRLLETVASLAYPSDLKRLRFHADARDTLGDLLRFIMRRDRGLPLSSQNIISNLLSDVYLAPLDDFAGQLRERYGEAFRYYRYVDDFYVLISFGPRTPRESLAEEMHAVAGDVADYLWRDRGLVLNALKCSRDTVRDDREFDQFVSKTNLLSLVPGRAAAPGPGPQARLREVLEVVAEMDRSYREAGKVVLEETDERLLKEVFGQPLKTYLASRAARIALDAALRGWPLVLTLYNAKAVVFLLAHRTDGLVDLRDFLYHGLQAGLCDSTHFCFLLERFLLHDQNDGSLDHLVTECRSQAAYFGLLKRLVRPRPGRPTSWMPYPHELLKSEPGLAIQIRRAVLAELEGHYNLAFNHTLNAFHVYCMVKDTRGIPRASYSRENVLTFLSSRLREGDVQLISSFFDRRNKNTISHPGDPGQENWTVTRSEYERYRGWLRSMLARLNG